MLKILIATSVLAAAIPASASVTVDVAATTRPWDVVPGGLNAAYSFGTSGSTGPVVVDFATAGITAGGSWAVYFISGETGSFGGSTGAGVNGYFGGLFKDGDLGSSGDGLPSNSTPGLWSSDPGAGVFLNALVFTFTDATGAIVGTPDAMNVFGDATNGYSYVFGKGSSATPFGATQIQLGINDDIFSDNGGALSVCVGASFDACTGTTPPLPSVPEPAAWTLLIAGFAVTGVAIRRRRGVAIA